MNTHIRILSGNQAGSVLEIGAGITRTEAENGTATGFAEWCGPPVPADVLAEPVVMADAPVPILAPVVEEVEVPKAASVQPPAPVQKAPDPVKPAARFGRGKK